MRARPPGFGLRCAPMLHHVFTACGIKDVSAKIHGSHNPASIVKGLVHHLQGGRKQIGLGNGIGGKGLSTDKGMGLRSVEELQIERGRYTVSLRRSFVRSICSERRLTKSFSACLFQRRSRSATSTGRCRGQADELMRTLKPPILGLIEVVLSERAAMLAPFTRSHLYEHLQSTLETSGAQRQKTWKEDVLRTLPRSCRIQRPHLGRLLTKVVRRPRA